MRFLLGTTALLTTLLGSCGDSSGGGSPGATMYRTYACAQCHGEKGEGSKIGLGPALKGKGSYWDESKLAAYLADPKGYAAGVDRLGNSPTAMPALPHSLSAEERAALIEYALDLMGS